MSDPPRLGVEQGTEGVPVSFKEIRLRFDIDTDAPQNKLDQLLELTDRYCRLSDHTE